MYEEKNQIFLYPLLNLVDRIDRIPGGWCEIREIAISNLRWNFFFIACEWLAAVIYLLVLVLNIAFLEYQNIKEKVIHQLNGMNILKTAMMWEWGKMWVLIL